MNLNSSQKMAQHSRFSDSTIWASITDEWMGGRLSTPCNLFILTRKPLNTDALQAVFFLRGIYLIFDVAFLQTLDTPLKLMQI